MRAARRPQRQELTGRQVDTVSDPAQAAIGLQCRWSGAASFVEVSSEDDARLDTIVDLVGARKSLSAADACDLFPTIAAVVAEESGPDFVVLVPAGDGLGVQAQTCIDGVFSSVVFSAPGLARSPAVEARARDALRTVHRNAIASGALAT